MRILEQLENPELREAALLLFKKRITSTYITNVTGYISNKKIAFGLNKIVNKLNKSGDPFYKKIILVKYKIEKKLQSFAKKYGKAKRENASLIRYLLWSTYYSFDIPGKIVSNLLLHNHLWKANDEYYVSGLHLGVGSPVFGVSVTGSKYRLVISTYNIQAFSVSSRWQNLLKFYEQQDDFKVPEIDLDVYTLYEVGREEGMVKISFTQKDKQFILDNYIQNK